jgi:hypothetical protein
MHIYRSWITSSGSLFQKIRFLLLSPLREENPIDVNFNTGVPLPPPWKKKFVAGMFGKKSLSHIYSARLREKIPNRKKKFMSYWVGLIAPPLNLRPIGYTNSLYIGQSLCAWDFHNLHMWISMRSSWRDDLCQSNFSPIETSSFVSSQLHRTWEHLQFLKLQSLRFNQKRFGNEARVRRWAVCGALTLERMNSVGQLTHPLPVQWQWQAASVSHTQWQCDAVTPSVTDTIVSI